MRLSVLRRATAAAAIALLGLGSCGIPTQEPQALSQEGHEELLYGTTTTSTVVGGEIEIRLFFVANDQIESVRRPFPSPPSLGELLRALEEQPRPEEQAAYEGEGTLVSLVPDGLDATLLTETPEESELGFRTIQVDDEGGLRDLLSNDPPQARLIVKQLACTFLNAVSGDVVGVQIIDSQGRLTLNDEAGLTIDGPARQENFDNCRTGTERQADAEASSTSSTEPPEEGG